MKFTVVKTIVECPIKLDKIHCQNCYFSKDGKCKHDEIMEERKERHKGSRHQPGG